jgi:hypothetical protein
MKTEVYSWRLAAEKRLSLRKKPGAKASLSLSSLLERVTDDWLAERRNANFDDEANQSAIRKRAMAAIGSIRGGDPTRSARASELVREIIARNHAKKSRAFARTRRTSSRTATRTASRAD